MKDDFGSGYSGLRINNLVLKFCVNLQTYSSDRGLRGIAESHG